MHLNQLKYFVSAAQYQSFTKAAEFHFITQTAITQQIKALEDTLSFALFDRRKRPVELTPAGLVFYREARSILARAEAAVARAAEAATGISGSLRIGYEKGYERSALSDHLRSFHRACPNILITCFREDTDTLAGMLRADELDIIFSWDSTGLSMETDIVSRLNLRSPLYLAVYDSHPFAARETIERKELKDERILFMSPSSRGDSRGDAEYLKLYEQAGFKPKILLKSNDIESILMMVAAEEGVSILPAYSVAKLTNADQLVFIPLLGEAEHEDIRMMWKEGCGNRAVDCFVSFMESQSPQPASSLL